MLLEILISNPQLAPGLAFFLAAALYASVGHRGASASLAKLGLFGLVQAEMKPIALALKIAAVLVVAAAKFAAI